MSIFTRLFKKNSGKKGQESVEITINVPSPINEENNTEGREEPKKNDNVGQLFEKAGDKVKLNSFIEEYDELLSKDEYLCRSKFFEIKKEYSDLYYRINTIKEIGTLSNYCKKEGIDLVQANRFLSSYSDLCENYLLIDNHNEEYIQKHLEEDKKYFDTILAAVDKNISLDEDQRRVCLDDEDYSLIIAGAGAGKTTTLAAKVKYLIEKRNINPQDILIIAFTNKAVNELKEKIKDKLGYDVPISTFHSCGRAIVKKDTNYADSKIESDNFYFIRDYVNQLVNNNKDMLQDMIMLFAYYLDLTEDVTKKISLEDHFTLLETADYTTLKSNIGEFNKTYIDKQRKTTSTILNETLRSNEEVQIANFLFLNGIEYEYEKPYKYPIPNANKIYTPDFYIKQGDNECYIEHFGITEDHKNSRYTKEELNNYIINMNYKIGHHAIHGTNLITTFSKYNDNRELLVHLKEELEKKGFELVKKSDEEVYNAILKNQDNKYVYKFIKIASRFISLFKTRDYDISEFEVLRRKTNNPRNILFLNIMEKVYAAYQLHLKEENAVDFEDMINESARLLREVQNVRDKVNFKYILIDEYQDISRARLNLVTEIKNATNAKVSVVGDDWQAIYGYAGSEINLFTKFKEQMGYASILKITRTYRNAQELIDIAGEFVQRNDAQIKKKLISNKHIEKAITINTYDGAYKSKDNPGSDFNKAKLLEGVLGRIQSIDSKNGVKEDNILVIGRYNFDGDRLIKTGLFYVKNDSNRTNVFYSKKYPNMRLTFMTAHSTKGLTYDNVVLINAINGKFGFPSQIEDDPIFNFVRTKDESYDFSEERRLFYVALTRTKNRVFILVPYQNPSTFVLELLDDYGEKINFQEDKEHPLNKNIELLSKNRTKCPCCGYPLQLQKNEAYGLKLYICTNEPEICDYMTNNLKSGKKSIHLCDKCGGVMFVKPRLDKSGFFFGCSNYKKDGTGCNNTENIIE